MSARFASTSTELDEIENKMELHVTAIEQLTTSLQSSTRSMKKAVQRRSTADKMNKTAEEDKQQQQMNEYLQIEADRVKHMS